MTTLSESFGRLRNLAAGQSRWDPLVESLVRRLLTAALTLAASVAVWLLFASFLFGQLIVKPSSTASEVDRVLQAASESIEEVVAFANSTEPVSSEIVPLERYPRAIEVAPVVVASNPFQPLNPPAVPAPPKPVDVGALIRERQAPPEPAILIRGILGRDGSYLAVLASDKTSRAVRPGESFMGWQVLAVSRDRVELEKSGKTRTIVWEGSK